MKIEGLTPDEQSKLDACSTPDDLIALAQAEGIELTDEQLDGVSGGWSDDAEPAGPCPKCSSTNTEMRWVKDWRNSGTTYKGCNNCGYTWLNL